MTVGAASAALCRQKPPLQNDPRVNLNDFQRVNLNDSEESWVKILR